MTRTDTLRELAGAIAGQSQPLAKFIVRNAAGKPETQTLPANGGGEIRHDANHALEGGLAAYADPDGWKAAMKVCAACETKKLKSMARAEGSSYNDALLATRQQRADHATGKRKDPPHSKDENIRLAAETRRAAKTAAMVDCQPALQAVADYLESLIPHVPAFRKHVEKQLKSVFPQVNDFGEAPVLKQIDALPAFIRVHVKSLREVPRVCNCTELLPPIE
jgi:hypothetical protein